MTFRAAEGGGLSDRSDPLGYEPVIYKITPTDCESIDVM